MIIIVMGVSGSGKSSVGQTLARKLGWDFCDADSFHSTAATEKMRRGIPLNDHDRNPWLKELQSAMANWLQAGKNTVLACSALKSSYRQILYCDCQEPLLYTPTLRHAPLTGILRQAKPRQEVKLIYLQGSFDLIFKRLQARKHHFMRENLLQSQFDILEEPKPSEAIYIDISQPIQLIVQEIINHLEIT